MSTGLGTLLSGVDKKLRVGRTREARELLRTLAERRIPRGQLVEMARLTWRVGLPWWGIELLYPIVRENRQAEPEEAAEYAACLLRLGARDEAVELLEAIDTPEASLYKAFACVADWDYGASIAWLDRYLGFSLRRYDRNLGLVNLAAALVAQNEHRRVKPLLRQLLYETSVRKNYPVLARVLELSAENFIRQKRWDHAEEFLAHAEKALSEPGLDLFFVKRLRALSGLLREKRPPGALEQVRRVRVEALGRRQWEVVRDLDRETAIALEDEALGARVYFGTPFASFRQKLAEEARGKFSLPRKFLWCPPPSATQGPLVDLAKEKDGAVKRLLAGLAGDFYRPFRVGSLFPLVHPSEWLHPSEAPARVNRGLLRLRTWFNSQSLPLVVRERVGDFWLTAESPVAIRLDRQLVPRKALSSMARPSGSAAI